MDKIEFRIWDKDDSYMLTYENYNPDEYFFQFDNFGKVEVYKANKPSSYPDEGIGYDKLNNIEVMRTTGLLDCEGKEIYEGDILTCEGGYEAPEGEDSHEEPAVVQWSETKLQWVAQCICHCEEWDLVEFDYEKIIGNIYENPELLK